MTPEPEKPTVTAIAPVTAIQPAPRVPLQDMLALVRDTELVAIYGREIVLAQLAVNRFDQDWRMALVFAKSGLFTDAQAVEQAMTKVQLGRSWNMEAADAMQHIYFVNGKPAVQNEYLAAKMRDAGIDWQIEWHRDSAGLCVGVTLWPARRVTELSDKDGNIVKVQWKPIMERQAGKEIPASVSFTKIDADRVKVKEDGKWIPLSQKSTYQSFPDDMYFWRAIARLRRRYATNVLSGAMVREEAEDTAPPQIEAPMREKQTAAPSEFMSGRQAKRRAGTEEIVTAALVDSGLATQESAPADSPFPVRPWKNREHMEQMLAVQKFRVGVDAYAKAAASTGVTSDMKPESDIALMFYATVKAMPDEEPASVAIPASTPTAPLPWADFTSMTNAFRIQRDRIGASEFERILNSKPGFTFNKDSSGDPVALAIYRDMEAVMVRPAVPEKSKKLF